MNKHRQRQSGFALIDALIGIVMVSLLCVAFLSSIVQASHTSTLARDKLSASIAALEMYEVGVHMAQTNYSKLFDETADTPPNCTTANPCHFTHNGTSWSIQSGTETLSDTRFTRSFALTNVYRDNATGDISAGGSVFDGDTLELSITVAWNTREDNLDDTITTYLHNPNP